ncbi:hypothetical protein Cni_G06576 [Canna indica]|uniref:Uncharacterized protein n=1 Tax=Canna indica TaxID=4628 RepID=A0AAQ3Q4W8_9LILI|nr:hypothetical protein Cni_G06576 [Canna indica]
MSEYEAQIKSLNEKWAMFNQLLQQQPRTFGAPPQLGLTSIMNQANLFHSHLGFSEYANVPQYANMSQYSNVPEISPPGGNARDSFSTCDWHIVMRMRTPKDGTCDPIAPLELPHSLHAFQRVSSSDSLNVEYSTTCKCENHEKARPLGRSPCSSQDCKEMERVADCGGSITSDQV